MGTLTNRWIAGHRPRVGRQKRGPLREIVEVLVHGRGLFEMDYARLACGHIERATVGARRARCVECGLAAGSRSPAHAPRP